MKTKLFVLVLTLALLVTASQSADILTLLNMNTVTAGYPATNFDAAESKYAATLLYAQGFESAGWEGDFTGYGTWGGKLARVTNSPHSGQYSLRGNQMEGKIDFITELSGKGNYLLDWRGSGHDIPAKTPNEMYFSYWLKHDDYDYESGYYGEGKLVVVTFN